MRRVLLFRLPGEESVQNATRLAQTLKGAGSDVTMVPYWPDGQGAWHSETCLLERDIGSAPRLSQFALQRQYGLTLDLLDLLAHSFATGPATPDLLLPESLWHQHLRGIAARVIQMFERETPDVVLIAHGGEIISRIITEVAAFKGIRALYWESGFFPGHLYVDAQAPHFFRGLCASDTRQPAAEVSAETLAFIQGWRQARQSKYSQDHSHEDAFLAWKSRNDRPVLFIAGQVPGDANAVVNLGEHASLNDLYGAILARLPADWRILFKPHPKAAPDAITLPRAPGDDLMVMDVDIHTAIEHSDAVFVHSSNTGLEAALLGKPVILSGRPVYSGYGITRDIGCSASPVPSMPIEAPAAQTVARVVQHLLAHSLIADGASEPLRARLETARPPVRGQKLAPYYSQKVQALILAARALHTQLQVTPKLHQALAFLSADMRAVLCGQHDPASLLQHPYGGLQTPVSVLAPHPVRGHCGDAIATLPVRLEECAFPQAYLGNMLKQHGAAVRVGCLLVPPPNASCAQHFTPDDLAHLCAGLGATFTLETGTLGEEAAGHTGYQPATLIVSQHTGQSRRTDSAPYLDWHIPPEAFSYGQPLPLPYPEHIPIDSTQRVFVYGPYIPLPPGEWDILWRAPDTSWSGRVRAMLSWPRWRRLQMEIVEQCPDMPAKITRIPFFRYRTRLRPSPHALYEFRTRWPSPSLSSASLPPSFSGIWLRQAVTTDLNPVH